MMQINVHANRLSQADKLWINTLPKNIRKEYHSQLLNVPLDKGDKVAFDYVNDRLKEMVRIAKALLEGVL